MFCSPTVVEYGPLQSTCPSYFCWSRLCHVFNRCSKEHRVTGTLHSVAACRATLEEIKDASVILHVVDISHENAAGQCEAVLQVSSMPLPFLQCQHTALNVPLQPSTCLSEGSPPCSAACCCMWCMLVPGCVADALQSQLGWASSFVQGPLC